MLAEVVDMDGSTPAASAVPELDPDTWPAAILAAAGRRDRDELHRLAFTASPAERRTARGMAEQVIRALDHETLRPHDAATPWPHARA
jgi:hypothetical protein